MSGLTNSNYTEHTHTQQQGLQAIYLDLETSKPMFNILPLEIDYFDTLLSKFLAKFATSNPHHLTSLTLVNIKQEKSETLWSFIGKVR